MTCENAMYVTTCLQPKNERPIFQRNLTSVSPALVAWRPPVDSRLKAFVLLDPLAVMFDSSSFSSIHVPVLLYRPQSDAYLNATQNVLAVASGLPLAPKVNVVPGSHFVFIDPCPAQIAGTDPLICQDEPGVDRTSIHRQIEIQVIDFLRENLCSSVRQTCPSIARFVRKEPLCREKLSSIAKNWLTIMGLNQAGRPGLLVDAMTQESMSLRAALESFRCSTVPMIGRPLYRTNRTMSMIKTASRLW